MASRIHSLLAATALAICSTAAAQAAPPFSFEEVDFTPDCAPNAAFDRLLGLLLPGRPRVDEDAVPEIDEPLFNAVSGGALHVLRLSRQAAWHGLGLVEVRVFYGIESGPLNFSLAFTDSPERVRAVWNARGWNLPPVGEHRVVDDEGIQVAAGIEADGPLAVVTCFRD